MTKLSEMSRDSSASSTRDDEAARVRNFAKHMLKSSLFIGTFLEKRFVLPLNSYRDVIKIADDENDLVDNLRAVRKRCARFFDNDVWIGITEPKTIGAPAGYNLWVILDQEVFGSYWYKIKTVEFYENEVRVKLEVVRPLSQEKIPVPDIFPQHVLGNISQVDMMEVGSKINFFLKEKIKELFSETITWPNIKHAVIFLFLLVSTLLTLAIHVAKYILDYLLKLLHETSGLIQVCTPIIINFMRLIMNTINGFYTLIAIMWRDRSPPKINHNVYQISPYEVPYYNMRALPYQSEEFNRNRGSSVKITPLDD